MRRWSQWDCGEYARVNTTPSFARASKCGVKPLSDPKNPIRSARVVSSVMIMTFGNLTDRLEVVDAGARLLTREAWDVIFEV